jgi:predicted nucleic acid-binding protein
MPRIASYLADPSAIARDPRSEVAARLDPLVLAGLVATCGVVDLELLQSARGPDEYARIAAIRRASFTWLPTEDVDIRRALETQAALTGPDAPRIAWPDLLTAAVAERHGVTLLHYHAGYDTIAELTGQAVEWVVPKGRVP